MNNFRYPILAKPSGITLDQHRFDVMSEGELLSKEMPFVFDKYENLVGKSLLSRLICVCKFHDDGKAEIWQVACQKDYEAYLKWKQKNAGGTYKDYTKESYNIAGSNIRQAGVRHEFYSLSLNVNKRMPLCLQAAIAAHHGKLGFDNRERWKKEGFLNYWEAFLRKSNDICDKETLEDIAKIQYEFAGPRSLLQLADHRASAKEDGDYIPQITSFQYTFPYKSKRGVQKLVESHWNDDILLVRAPTGAGKTDASLLWASLQIKNKRAGKLIIAMPTRFTSNALAINVLDSFSDTGLYHSSAWFNKFQQDVDCGKIEKHKAKMIHEYARLLETPVTVCTIDHLLMSLTLTREDHQLITFNIANSCLVIDEADFYDEFTQANILVLLELLRYWKVPILLMSASLPESVLVDYNNIGYSVKKILEDKSDNIRNRFSIKKIRKYYKPSDIEDLLYLIIEKGHGIIYANTVDKAISFYNWFMQYNNKTEKKINVILYHSRFSEPDKGEKEEKILEMLGRKVWNDKKANGIVIMTQIGEMSINISADIMISEICPIDRLTQRAGRMCRFDKTKIGDLYLLLPQKNDCLYPAPYGNYDIHSKSWIPCDSLIKTINILEIKTYNANALIDMLNQVYPSNREYSPKSISNAKYLREYFMINWLINPKQKSDIDDTDINYWKSRDITTQDTVFVQKPDMSYFTNFMEFQNWKIYNSIELPVYLIERGRKQHKIDIIKIHVREETTIIYVIREGFYNNEIGVSFIEEELFM